MEKPVKKAGFIAVVPILREWLSSIKTGLDGLEQTEPEKFTSTTDGHGGTRIQRGRNLALGWGKMRHHWVGRPAPARRSAFPRPIRVHPCPSVVSYGMSPVECEWN